MRSQEVVSIKNAVQQNSVKMSFKQSFLQVLMMHLFQSGKHSHRYLKSVQIKRTPEHNNPTLSKLLVAR